MPRSDPIDTPSCLIVSTNGRAYADELGKYADEPLPFKVCLTVDEALTAHSDETILFGDPTMIAEILPTAPGIEWVQSSWAGVKPLLDLERRDYVLTGIKDVFGPQMSEYVIGYLLAHELRMLERMDGQRQQQWVKTHSGTLEGKRLGIMGTGSIGQHIARSAAAFGMQVIGLSRSGTQTEEFDNTYSINELSNFLKAIDHLVSVLPETAETDNLLNADTLAALPTTAYFVNVGRSNVVDDAALLSALRDGTLAGAALDVFDQEPLPANSPLWNAPNLSVTAHIAAVSRPSLIIPLFVKNYRRYVNQQELNHVVDFDAGY